VQPVLDLPSLGGWRLYEISIFTGSNAVKIDANMVRKDEAGRIALLKVLKELCKETATLFCWRISLGHTDMTEPRLVQLW